MLGRVGYVSLELRRDILTADVYSDIIVKGHLKTRAGWDHHGMEVSLDREKETWNIKCLEMRN